MSSVDRALLVSKLCCSDTRVRTTQSHDDAYATTGILLHTLNVLISHITLAASADEHEA